MAPEPILSRRLPGSGVLPVQESSEQRERIGHSSRKILLVKTRIPNIPVTDERRAQRAGQANGSGQTKMTSVIVYWDFLCQKYRTLPQRSNRMGFERDSDQSTPGPSAHRTKFAAPHKEASAFVLRAAFVIFQIRPPT